MVGQRTEARGFFEEAIRLDAKSDEAYFQLGLILRGEGHLRKAKEMFLKALVFHPNNANVHNNLGVILLEQKEFQTAAESFRKALEIYPEHINAQYNLGLALWGLGNTKAAIEQYRTVLGVKPNWAVPANSLAWILATDGDDTVRNGEEAVRWALVACQGEGKNNPEFLDTLAVAFARAGRFKEAEHTAMEAVTLSRQTGDEELTKEIEQRRILYKSGKAFVE
jgi:Flp pilus assembly protein TadD